MTCTAQQSIKPWKCEYGQHALAALRIWQQLQLARLLARSLVVTVRLASSVGMLLLIWSLMLLVGVAGSFQLLEWGCTGGLAHSCNQ
jgi:hypothetical protein